MNLAKNISIFFIILFCANYGVASNIEIKSATTIIQQNGITWLFSKPVLTGQFISGDYWIVAPEDGVSVKITPPPSEGRNGSQINPQNSNQPFDSRAGVYDESLLFRSGGTIKPGETLISTISETTEGSDTDVLGRYVADEHSFVQSAAALTVLKTPPPERSFRPPIFGTEKTIYS